MSFVLLFIILKFDFVATETKKPTLDSLKNILFPTLACALYQDELNRQILEEDLSLDLITAYLSSPDLNFDSLPLYFKLDNRIPVPVQSAILADLAE